MSVTPQQAATAAGRDAEARPARPSRPCGMRACQAVLDATRELLGEGGLPAATIDYRAGASSPRYHRSASTIA
jgi:hypothetical protein